MVASQDCQIAACDPSDAEPAPHLSVCLGGTTAHGGRFTLELRLDSDAESGARIAVDSVGATEDLLIRPLSPFVASMGPFSGGIVGGDGSVRLVIDAYGLAPRARALQRITALSRSERPGATG